MTGLSFEICKLIPSAIDEGNSRLPRSTRRPFGAHQRVSSRDATRAGSLRVSDGIARLRYIVAQMFGGAFGVMFVDAVVPPDYKARVLSVHKSCTQLTFAHSTHTEASHPTLSEPSQFEACMLQLAFGVHLVSNRRPSWAPLCSARA